MNKMRKNEYYSFALHNNIVIMTLFLENSFSLGNYISISNRIKKIPFYYLHFLPISRFRNLDEHYKILPISKSNLIQREIKHKLVYFQKEEQEYSCDYERNKHNPSMLFKKSDFAKCIYHVFYSCSVLHANKISFTLNECPFVSSDRGGGVVGVRGGGLPLLYDFSQSFYFPIIQSSTFKLYFPESLLQNQYIAFDQFLLVYLVHHPTTCWTTEDTDSIIELFSTSRENIEINTIKENMDYFHQYHSDQIIQYLLQFKYTWSYYSLCYFFIVNYSDLLHHFSLYDLFYSYIHSSSKDRSGNIVSTIHSSLFST